MKLQIELDGNTYDVDVEIIQNDMASVTGEVLPTTVADLRGKTLQQRAAALTAIAHPQFRDTLWKEPALTGVGGD